MLKNPDHDTEYSVVQPVNSNTLIELLDKDAIPSENVKFVHWKDFDRALQSDYDLYLKVMSLGRRPDRRLKEELTYNSYIPLFGNINNDGNGEDKYLFYKGHNQLYENEDPEFIRFNSID